MFQPVYVERDQLSTVPDGNQVVTMINHRGDFNWTCKFVKVSTGIASTMPNWPFTQGYLYPFDEIAESSAFDNLFFMDTGPVRPIEEAWVDPTP